MIFGRLDNLEAEAATLPGNIFEGLRFLENTDFATVPEGRLEIDGERMFALVQDYTPKPKDEARPETHKRYIDIQYLASGSELIGFAPLGTTPDVSEDLLEERDVRFHDPVAEESMVLLSAGSYAVFYPWDVHRPGCKAEDDAPVRKVVVKIQY